ncbi:MAG: FecR domain-containing protein [Candidatus Omnitrophica bacterium]|nr:FecR domain-containing protein [Candidatus Omnitrophota bacterium]
MVQKFCLSVLALLVLVVAGPACARADFQLVKTERMQKNLSPGWGQFNEAGGQAIYSNVAEDTGVYYAWSIPQTLTSTGVTFDMSAEARKGKGYPEAGISVETNYDARIKGDLSRINFKGEPMQVTRQSRSGKIIPPVKAKEFAITVRLGTVTGEDAVVVYTYSGNAAPAAPAAAASLNGDLNVTTSQLKSSDTIHGLLKVNASGIPNIDAELEFTAFLTTYTATDAIEDFASDYANYLTEGGTYTNERVKYRTTEYRHSKAHNGLNEYKLEEILPVKIPAGLDQGEYLLIVFIRLKDSKVMTTARAGVDLTNNPKIISLVQPAKITPEEGFQGDNFYLELKYAVEGIPLDTSVNLRVRGNVTGPDPIGVPEQNLNLGNTQDQGNKTYKKTGEVTLGTDDIREAGDYVWHYTIYAGDGFAPFDGEIKFKVKAGVANAGAPVDGVPGEIRIDGIGKDTLEIDSGSGWTQIKNGDVIPVGKFPKGIAVRTNATEPVLKFPDGRRVRLSEGTEIILRGDKGDAALNRGKVNVIGGDGSSAKAQISTPTADIMEVGTIFSVSYDANTGATVVDVQQGEVLVTPKNPKVPPVRLKVGDKAKFGDLADIATNTASGMTGIIDTVSPAVGAEVTPGGKPFEDRLRHLFNSQNVSDDVVYDTFAAMSLIIAKRALPGSCYKDDPYVHYPTFDAHRKYATEKGRSKSANNLVWKIGASLDCLSNQADKDALIAELTEVLRQAENGSVTRVADLSSGGGISADLSSVAGIYRWDWATSGEPVDQGATATLNVDGTMTSSYGHSGKWKIENGVVYLDWGSVGTNDLHATADPNVLEGKNQNGARIRAIKKTAYNFGKNPINASAVPGVWKWDWNKAGEPVDQGAGVTFFPDGTITSTYAGYYGTWKVSGGKIDIVWLNVNQTNALYSTSDPNVLEGWGQFGERIRATKKDSIASQNPSYEYGIDRPGWDYNHFSLAGANPDLCFERCRQEEACRAFTYVKPGYQGPEPMCWLKNSVPPQAKGADFAVSGVVRP